MTGVGGIERVAEVGVWLADERTMGNVNECGETIVGARGGRPGGFWF